MEIQSTQEALFVASEMERGAVQLYQRAIAVMKELNREDEPLYGMLFSILEDEKGHLAQFEAMFAGLDMETERNLLLAAVGSGVLFEGGLMGAVRAGLLESVEDMLKFAADCEQKAAAVYQEMAEKSQDELAKRALLCIAADEKGHLADILARLDAVNEIDRKKEGT